MMKQWMKKKNLWILMIMVAALALGRTVLFRTGDVAAVGAQDQRIVSELLTVMPKTVEETVDYLGTLESEHHATISPKVTADVLVKAVQEGDFVKSGEKILQLDTAQLEAKQSTLEAKRTTLQTQAAFVDDQVTTFYSQNPIVSKIRSLEVNLAFQREELSKIQALYNAGATSASAYDQMSHQVDLLALQLAELRSTAEVQYEGLVQERAMTGRQMEELEAGLEETALSIAEATIKAPFDGVVTAYHVNEGDLAMPGKPVVTLSGTDSLKVTLQLSEGDLVRLEKGTPAILSVNGVDHQGEVSSLAAMVNQKTRIGTAEVSFTDPGSVQSPMGSSVAVTLMLDQHEEAIFVPRSAIKVLGGEEVVYVADASGLVSERQVTTGVEINQEVEITSGLSGGERIAIRGVESLFDGAELYTLDGEV